jgi:hypothetical protein
VSVIALPVLGGAIGVVGARAEWRHALEALRGPRFTLARMRGNEVAAF